MCWGYDLLILGFLLGAAFELICRGFKPPASVLIVGAPENRPPSLSKLDIQRQMLLLEQLPEQGLSQRHLAQEQNGVN